jgi:peroxiredoxin
MADTLGKVILFLFWSLAACGSVTEETDGLAAEPTNIRVKVAGMQDGKVYLIGTYETLNLRLDSTEMKIGEARFSRDSLYPTGLYYLYYPNQSFNQILLDKDQTFSLVTQANDLVENMQVENSIDNELLYRGLRYDTKYQITFDSLAALLKKAGSDQMKTELEGQQKLLQQKRKEFLTELFEKYPESFYTFFKKAGQNPDPVDVRNPDGSLNATRQVQIYRSQFWQDVDFDQEGLIRTPVIANKLKRHMTELTVQQADSILTQADYLMSLVADKPAYYKFFANWIVLHYEPTKTSLMDPEAVFTRMVQKYFTYDKAFWSDSAETYSIQLRAYEMSKSLLGLSAPDVTASDVHGNLQSLLSRTSEYLIVYLFNPTCEHCIEETPKMEAFYRQHKNQSVDVYGIGVDTSPVEWKEYVVGQGLTFTNVFDPTYKAIYAKYYVDITPEIYVLSPDRIIIAKNIKVDQIKTVIDRDREKRSKH